MIVLLLSVCLFGGIILALPLLFTDYGGSLPYDVSFYVLVLGTRVADTLDFSSMVMSIFNIERSHYFVDFALQT